MPKACCSFLASDVRKTPMPHMASGRRHAHQQHAERRPPVGPEGERRHRPDHEDRHQPGDEDGEQLPEDDLSRTQRGRGQTGQRPGRTLHEQRAHAQPAADEEEDHGDVGREEVEVDLAAALPTILGGDGHRRGRGAAAAVAVAVEPESPSEAVDVPGTRRVEHARDTGRHRLRVLLPQLRRPPGHHVEPRRRGRARVDHRDEQAVEVHLAGQHRHPAGQVAVGDARLHGASRWASRPR